MMQSGIKVVYSSCPHDCGGRCVLKVHVKDGTITHIETDDGEEPQIRACARGRAQRQRIYAPDRFKYPLKRAGARGTGKFERITWDEAINTIADEMKRIKQTYGPQAIFHFTSSGSFVLLNCGGPGPGGPIQRLLHCFGGCTSSWGGASAQGSWYASTAMYGTTMCTSTHDHLKNSRIIILWGFNPAETVMGTNTMYEIIQAKEHGTRFIGVDPRFTDTVATLASQWIPIRPGTDSAMLLAMAYVIIEQGLQQQHFLDSFTVGFDLFKNYVMGKDDGIPKTPTWAEAITGVPSETIEALAVDYATEKPSALIAGMGPGRTAFGEQFHRLTITLAAMTGNIGISGGSAAGNLRGPQGSNFFINLPVGENPVERDVPPVKNPLDNAARDRSRVAIYDVFDAILGGKERGYPADIKMVYITMANPLNQLLNINKGIQAFNKPEFIVVHEQFMTATAKFADIVLPVQTLMERNDIARPALQGAYYLYLQKAIEPYYECKSDWEIAVLLADRLNIKDFSDKNEDEWLKYIVSLDRQMSTVSANYEEFKQKGVYKVKPESLVAFKDQVEDPKHHPFRTPSGKIEIYSQQIAELEDPLLPPIPKYVESWESTSDPLAQEYPLQLITFHQKLRCHSSFDNTPWLRELRSHGVWINPQDAENRGINDHNMVRVFNERGQTLIQATVTERITPGVVCIGQGVWFQADDDGLEQSGSVNVLTLDSHSPGGSFPSNTCLVQVEKHK